MQRSFREIIKGSIVLLYVNYFLHNVFKPRVNQKSGELSLIGYRAKIGRWRSVLIDNNLYGLYHLFSFYPHNNAKAYIEHGLFLGIGVKEDVHIFPKIDTIITISELRKTRIRDDGWEGEIMVVGNYIKYFNRITRPFINGVPLDPKKNRALIFLPHSVKGIGKSVEGSELRKILRKLSLKHEELLVCVYISFGYGSLDLDYLPNVHLVTAGHRYDEYFLDRLSIIIRASNMTYSFNVGTHIGYCYGLGLDHQILDLAVVENVDSKLGIKEKQRIQLSAGSIKKDHNEIYRAFKQEGMTLEKDKVYKKYWE